jgi:hypothetical protein
MPAKRKKKLSYIECIHIVFILYSAVAINLYDYQFSLLHMGFVLTSRLHV